jgi:hypothetical protein
MQIQMQAFAKRPRSLRTLITNDLSRGRHEKLYVEKFKNPTRPRGWAKILGDGIPGAINIEWDPDQRMLVARAIAKKGNKPHELLGVFVDYLIERHGRRISHVNIQLR